jgi:hypothetical protein
VISLLVVVVLLAGLVIDVEAHRRHKTQPPSVAVTLTRARHRHRHQLGKAIDPLATPAMRHYIASRSGDISAAVEDLQTGQEWVWNPGERAQTASIVKADILETLLHEAQVVNTPLDEATADEVQGMIENSNDQDASELWNQAGGAGAIASYDASIGMHQTIPNDDGYWGETTTSAMDQILLLRQLVDSHGVLNRASQDYELGLMEQVEADQAWGVSGGVPSGVSVALKNGWVPLTSGVDWEINSIGRIKGDGRRYLIAVLTAHDPSQAYGIETIRQISTLVWGDLKPKLATG